MSQIQVELQEWMGSDRSIASSAWTSSLDYQAKEKRTDEDVVRVVKMLADNKHSTPFESVIFKFWIKMPIATDRQHMTHRIGSHNGMSGRYRTMPNDWLVVPNDIDDIVQRIKDENSDLGREYNNFCNQANDWYQKAIKQLKHDEKMGHITNSEYKRCREFFRGVLPQHNMTERVTIFNLRSFCNYQKLRNSEHAQPEIKEVAELMLAAVKTANICPVALTQLEQNGWSI